MTALRLVETLPAVRPYSPQSHPAPCDLDLAGTEFPPLDADLVAEAVASVTPLAVSYPDATALTAELAEIHGITADRILVTAGADDALARAFRIALDPSRSAVLTTPTFEMLPRFATLTGATIREVPWSGDVLPLTDLLRSIDPTTALVAVVSPNNPTGSIATAADLRAIALAAPHTLVIADLAYVGFADTDPTDALLDLPNVVITRSFSKLDGLAAWRVGYAIASPEIIMALRATGLPYPVAQPALAVALASLQADWQLIESRIGRVRSARGAMTALLESQSGIEVIPSQANFVTVTGPRARWLRDALAGLGIRTRGIEARGQYFTRITCPLDDDALDQLCEAIATALRPDVLLFDLDGVLADVSRSYRETILATTADFGVTLTSADVQRRKAAGNANDDWTVTHDLITAAGIAVTLGEVTDAFERRYQGDANTPGLRLQETLLPGVLLLQRLLSARPLGIVTGRPRADAERFLIEQQITDCFNSVVTREDAALKPDPAPVRLALKQLGVRRAWMIGDTPDDMQAARRAGVVPLGIVAPGDDAELSTDILLRSGAARVLTTLEEIECLF